MTGYTAGWGGIGTVLFLVFVIIPSIRWGVGFGTKYGPRWGRRYSQWWGGWEDEDGPQRRPGRHEIASLKAELDGKLGEIDNLSARVAELENRLDFAERLLAQRADQPQLSSTINQDG
jgi:hypothetical protein